jgi:hypothetical protein
MSEKKKYNDIYWLKIPGNLCDGKKIGKWYIAEIEIAKRMNLNLEDFDYISHTSGLRERGGFQPRTFKTTIDGYELEIGRKMKKNSILDDIANFVEGESNYIKDKLDMLNEDIKLMAEERQAICLECEELDLEEEICKNCGCSWPSLTFSKGKTCPLGKWKEHEKSK